MAGGFYEDMDSDEREAMLEDRRIYRGRRYRGINLRSEEYPDDGPDGPEVNEEAEAAPQELKRSA